jgi:hypothetical protein
MQVERHQPCLAEGASGRRAHKERKIHESGTIVRGNRYQSLRHLIRVREIDRVPRVGEYQDSAPPSMQPLRQTRAVDVYSNSHIVFQNRIMHDQARRKYWG